MDLIRITKDGIVTDHQGLPLPRRDVIDAFHAVLRAYSNLTADDLAAYEDQVIQQRGKAWEQFRGRDLS